MPDPNKSRTFAPLGGVIPILVTPFELDGTISMDQLDREIDFLANTGVGWVGFGFGSEVWRLDPDELGATMQHAVQYSAGRIGIVGNAEMTSVRAGIAAVRRVAEAGAQLALVHPRLAAGIGSEALFDAFGEVAEQGTLPIIIQDAPQISGVTLPAATLARLLVEITGVVAVKIEPLAPAPKISAISAALEGRAATIIGGSGGFDFIHELQRGSSGTMPGPAHPEVFDLARRQLARGERASAFQSHARLLPLITLCSRNMDTFLFVQKYVLHRRGILEQPVLRSPHVCLEERLRHEVDELLDDLGLLEFFDDCASKLHADGVSDGK